MQGKSHGTAASAAVRPDTIPSARAPAGGEPRVIAIVGGGFSGTCLAIHLLRRGCRRGTRLLRLRAARRARRGRGLCHARLSVSTQCGRRTDVVRRAQPHDFLDFANQQGIHAAAGDYLPRQVYGDYLRARFSSSLRCQRMDAARHPLPGPRVAAARRGPDGRWVLWLDDGTLAGCRRPSSWRSAIRHRRRSTEFAPIAASGHYIHDPWSIGARGHENMSSVLLVGSGLTMIDAALRLAAIRPRVRHIHVLSRHGLLPEAQATRHRPLQARRAASSTRHADRCGGSRGPCATLAGEIDRAGGDWREVIAAIRPQLPAHLAWTRSTTTRAVPASPARALGSHIATACPPGRWPRCVRSNGSEYSTCTPAASTHCASSMTRSKSIWRPRGARRTRAWLVDRVVNCTGPDHRVADHPDPLVQIAAGEWIDSPQTRYRWASTSRRTAA